MILDFGDKLSGLYAQCSLLTMDNKFWIDEIPKWKMLHNHGSNMIASTFGLNATNTISYSCDVD